MNECDVEKLKKDFKNDIEIVLKEAELHIRSSAELAKEGNVFEFDACKLILQGTAGAFAIYVAGLQYLQRSNQINELALTLWGLSLVLGIFHLLRWSEILLEKSKKEKSVHDFILSELLSENTDPQGLKKSIFEEKRKHVERCSKGEKIDSRELKFTVPYGHVTVKLIYLQMIFLAIGALFIFFNISFESIWLFVTALCFQIFQAGA